MSKFYVYRGFNQFDGLGGSADSKEEAQKLIQEAMTDEFGNTFKCSLDDIYEFDCQEAFEASRLYTEICDEVVE